MTDIESVGDEFNQLNFEPTENDFVLGLVHYNWLGD